MIVNNVLLENLAYYAHAAWSGWMQYMFSKSQQNDDGSVTIPAALVERWTRQMNTVYDDLPESEKQSDLKEAHTMLDIVNNYGNNKQSYMPEVVPLRYWQHDETGRVCAKSLHPGERWSEIAKGQYDSIVGAMKVTEPK